MLRQRVITALALLAVLLPALFAQSSVPFALLTLVLMAAASWEWGRLNSLSSRRALWLGAACALACVVTWWSGEDWRQWRALWGGATVAWVISAAWLIATGVSAWGRIPRAVRLLGGLFALWLTWLATVTAHQVGVNLLLSILALVWAADIAAYFAGRALGTKFIARKLAPSISPGKSWEGAIGGFIGVLLVSALWRWFDQAQQPAALSLYSRLWTLGALPALAGLGFLTALSVAGDLVESLVKRSAGVKDSSGLLPGHGGVLDRVDALLPTLPAAMALLTYAP